MLVIWGSGMHYGLRSLAIMGLGSVSTGLGVATAQAQQPIELPGITIQAPKPAVVTARKRTERADQVPVSVDVLDSTGPAASEGEPGGQIAVPLGGSIDDQRISTVIEAVEETPSANITSFGEKRTTLVSIRGLGPLSNISGAIDDTTVITFVDGVPQPLQGSDASLLDVERVEVLKGPQNVLFGRNTSGGAISIITNAPSFEREWSVRSEIGTDMTHKVEIVGGGEIIPGAVAGRVALRKSGADGYMPNLYTEDLGGDDTISARGSLLITPSERTHVTLSLSGEDYAGNPNYFTWRESPDYPLAAVTQADLDRQLVNGSIKLEHGFDAFMFTSLSAYTSSDIQMRTDDKDGLLWGAMFGVPPEFFLGDGDYSKWDEGERKLFQEFRLNSHANATIPWVAGVSIYRDSFDALYENANTTASFLNGTRDRTFTTTGAGIFGEATYPIFDRFKLSLGARYVFEEKELDATYVSNGAPGTVPYFAESASDDFSFWTGRAALSYDWSSTATSYVSIARGYKTGGFQFLAQDNAQGLPTPAFESARSITYETGLKTSWFDGRGRLNVALFYNDVTDEQLYALDFGTFAFGIYNGNTRSYGLEVDAGYRIMPGLDITGGFALLDGEVHNLDPSVISLVPGLNNGNDLVQAPSFAGNLALTYRTNIGTIDPFGPSDLLARIGYRYVGERFADIGNQAELEAYHLVSGRIGLEFDKGELYLFGDNLLDEQYTINAQPYVPGVSSALPARGRVVGIGSLIRF